MVRDIIRDPIFPFSVSVSKIQILQFLDYISEK